MIDGTALEVRANGPDWLDVLELTPELPEDLRRYVGTVSCVEGYERGPVRVLPTIYLGNAPVSSAKTKDDLAESLAALVDVLKRSFQTPVYAIWVCSFAGRTGLYFRDIHERSSFRLGLVRQGVEFPHRPFAKFVDGEFSSQDPDFTSGKPEFVIFGTTDEGDTVTELPLGFTVASVASCRMGSIEPSELSQLVSALRTVKSVGAPSPRVLGTWLKTNLE